MAHSYLVDCQGVAVQCETPADVLALVEAMRQAQEPVDKDGCGQPRQPAETDDFWYQCDTCSICWPVARRFASKGQPPCPATSGSTPCAGHGVRIPGDPTQQ